MLEGDRRRLEMAYSLMMTLPGTPIIRYGDEIGMGDDLRLPERNCARTPMQWSDEPQGGFTISETPVLPPISEGPYGFQHVNVAGQRRDPNSMLNWMERLIRMRKEVPEIGWGEFRCCAPEPRRCWRCVMSGEAMPCCSCIICQLEPREVRIAPGAKGSHEGVLVNLLVQGSQQVRRRDGIHCLLLEPYGYRWFRVGGLDYLLRRPVAGPLQS